MSKLAIILSIAIFVSSTDAIWDSWPIDQANERLTSTINEVDFTLESQRIIAMEISANLHANAAEYDKTVQEQMSNVLKAVRDQVKKNKTDAAKSGIDVTECSRLVVNLDRSKYTAIAKLRNCTNQQLARINESYNIIIKVHKVLNSKLTIAKEARKQCNDRFIGGSSCLTNAESKLDGIAKRLLLIDDYHIKKLRGLYKTSYDKLENCVKINATKPLYTEASTAIKAATKCYLKKIGEAHTSTVAPTTITTAQAESKRTTKAATTTQSARTDAKPTPKRSKLSSTTPILTSTTPAQTSTDSTPKSTAAAQTSTDSELFLTTPILTSTSPAETSTDSTPT